MEGCPGTSEIGRVGLYGSAKTGTTLAAIKAS